MASEQPPSEPRLAFLLPGGGEVRGALRAEESVAAAALRLGLDLRMSCGGQGSCGSCEMIVAGSRRRSCQLQVPGQYEVPYSALFDPAAQIEEGSAYTARGSAGPGALRILELEIPAAQALPPPGQADDLGRLTAALAAAGCSAPVIPFLLYEQIRAALADAARVYALIFEGPEGPRLLGVSASRKALPSYAVALDIGTTTLAAELFDGASCRSLGRASCGNAQVRLAEDVAARISVCDGKPALLQDLLVRRSILPLLGRLAAEAGLSLRQIGLLAVSANTVMTHLLLGWDPSGLGGAPFNAVSLAPPLVACAEIGLSLAPGALLACVPAISAYVGGDLTSGAVVSGLAQTSRTVVLIDVGTNGEILLAHQGRLYGCATPAGPAFEGGRLRCGVRARKGAIEHLGLTPSEISFQTIGNELPVGLCGSACLDLLGQGYLAGVLSQAGRFNKGHPRIEEFVSEERRLARRLVLAPEAESAPGRGPISVSETELSELLQAKAAIFSGLLTLTQSVGLTLGQVEEVLLAGGFARHVDLRSAVACGLLPDGPALTVVGNTSLAGAALVITECGALARMLQTAALVKVLELNFDPSFETNFVNALFLPNRDRSLFPSVRPWERKAREGTGGVPQLERLTQSCQ